MIDTIALDCAVRRFPALIARCRNALRQDPARAEFIWRYYLALLDAGSVRPYASAVVEDYRVIRHIRAAGVIVDRQGYVLLNQWDADAAGGP